jgi:hypothetical protein
MILHPPDEGNYLSKTDKKMTRSDYVQVAPAVDTAGNTGQYSARRGVAQRTPHDLKEGHVKARWLLVLLPAAVIAAGLAETPTDSTSPLLLPGQLGAEVGSDAQQAAQAATNPNWVTNYHQECCEGNLAAAGSNTYVLLPELESGNDIKRSTDGGRTWQKMYPPADVSVPFGIEGDLRAFGEDIVFFGTEVAAGVAAHSDNRGATWTVTQIPVAWSVNDQAWNYMGPLSNVCAVQTEPYVLTGWYRIGSVALFSCDGGLTWPIQTPLVGLNGLGPEHVVCQQTATAPGPKSDTRIPNANFALMRAGRHGGWGTDAKFYWSEVAGGSLYICKTGNFGATWEGIRHPLAPGSIAGHVPTGLAFDDKGTLYVLHANKLYVSFDQGKSIAFVHTLPRWGNDGSVGDDAADMFVVKGGTIHIGLKEAAPNNSGNIWYLQGNRVDTATPSWMEELVDTVGADRLDFMMIVVDANGIPTIGYTTPPDSQKGVTTSSRLRPLRRTSRRMSIQQ